VKILKITTQWFSTGQSGTIYWTLQARTIENSSALKYLVAHCVESGNILYRFTYRMLWRVVTLSIYAMTASSALAQARSDIRPDAGTLLDFPLPAPFPAPQIGPLLSLPLRNSASPASASLRITPAAFIFAGNRIFPRPILEALLAGFVDKPTDLAGLAVAVNTVSAYYRSRGYLLTEAYLPEQAFSATGGTVTINVIEAKVGRVSVDMQGDTQSRLSRAYVENLVASHLKKGDDITEYALDKPILLLRDLAGYDASATVEPGQNLGEADIRVAVNHKGSRIDGSLGVDNYGAIAAGAIKTVGSVNINNLLGRGDVLALSSQFSDQPGSSLFRAGYTAPVGGLGTRVGVNLARLNYALGKQFAALGATGKADILGINLSHPLLRGRDDSLYASVNVEQKRFLDETASPSLKAEREIASLRVGLAGNFTDNLAGATATALNAYAVNATLGRLKLDPANLALDGGLGGLRTAGLFNKLSVDYQRAQFFGGTSSLYFAAQAQLASKNLSSAEKIALGGPNGVRGYPVGEGIGDAGALMSLEYRYQLPAAISLAKAPVSLLTFYDYGYVRFNQNGPSLPGAKNSVALSSVGVGAMVGKVGSFLIKTHVAWRTNENLPSTGDADRSPRAWLSAQTWF
jgi:hemolysin activation/secretion protein